MKFILPTICFIFNVLIAELYPLAQKPFLEGVNPSDGFARGTFLIIVASSDLEDILYTDSEYIENFIHFKQTQGYNVIIQDMGYIGGSSDNLRSYLKFYYEENIPVIGKIIERGTVEGGDCLWINNKSS